MTDEQVMIKPQEPFGFTSWIYGNHLHQHAAQSPKVQQSMTTLYELWHQLPPAAQMALYQQPLETLLKQPTPKLQTWVQQGQHYFNQQLKAAKNQATLQTPNIWKFFGPQIQQNDDLQLS